MDPATMSSLMSFAGGGGGGGSSGMNANFASAISSGLEGFGGYLENKGLAKSLDLNAGLLDIEAGGIIKAGEFQGRRMREQGDKFIARQRAMYSKAGVKFSGSAAQVWAETERNIRLDITMTQLNAANKANALGFQALNMRIAAGQARTKAYLEMSKGLLNMTASLYMGQSVAGGGSGGGGNLAGATKSFNGGQSSALSSSATRYQMTPNFSGNSTLRAR